MPNAERTSVKFDPSQIKPLDGSPMMSANCWNAVLETVDDRARGGGKVRCLEWGAGNSTVSLVRKGRKMGSGFELISVEHETNFFHWLAESVLAEFLDGPERGNLKVEWRSLKPASVPPSKAWEVARSHRALECSPLAWQILLGNRRLQYIDGVKPQFGFSILKLLKQSVRLGLMRMAYGLWLAESVVRSFADGAKGIRTHDLGDPTLEMSGDAVEKGKFFALFEEAPTAGRLAIERDGVRVELWHLPVLENAFWSRGVVLDGSIRQLFSYVCLPLEGLFDVVFIDGRARVSCIKRAHRDGLLKEGGSLFVHDAFRAEMAEGFRLFGQPFTFIHGTNVTLNGQARCKEDFGPPLARVGDSLGAVRWEITQELFTYRKTRDHAAS